MARCVRALAVLAAIVLLMLSVRADDWWDGDNDDWGDDGDFDGIRLDPRESVYMSYEDIVRRLPSKRATIRKPEEEEKRPSFARAKPAPKLSLEDLPENFDWSDVDGTNYLTSSWNQHLPTYCGSCYLHATLSSVSDRIKVAKGGRGPDVMLSRQSVLNCIFAKVGSYSKGCLGGNALDVFSFLHEIGAPDETCNQYIAKPRKTCDRRAMCTNCMAYAEPVMDNFKCWSIENYTSYRVSEFGELSRDEEAIMSEIRYGGPVACSLATDDNFDYNYTGGVWTTRNGLNDSNHIVEVTGWGTTEDGLKFWQARNSWGSYWGDNGFFKIERGANVMLIEDSCWFVRPDVSELDALNSGELIGSMHGLREKDKDKREIDLQFTRALRREADASREAELAGRKLRKSKKHRHGARGLSPWMLTGAFLVGGVFGALAVTLLSAFGRGRRGYQRVE